MPSFNRRSGCTNQVVTENQWMETDYTYGDAFDMNYFTAPYNGLYQFYANIKLHGDSISSISMNSSIGLLFYTRGLPKYNQMAVIEIGHVFGYFRRCQNATFSFSL